VSIFRADEFKYSTASPFIAVTFLKTPAGDKLAVNKTLREKSGQKNERYTKRDI
jgi:hypothetical protein